MYTLGINAAFHDSSACLVQDGRLIAAVEEERFTQIKHGKRPIPFSAYELPFHAIDYCLKKAGIHLNDIDHVAYSFDPYILLKEQKGAAGIEIPLEPGMENSLSKWNSPWDPLFLSAIVNAPGQLRDGYPHHLQKRFAGNDGSWEWHFVEHHIAHAASAFYPSGFSSAATITLDGRGEIATTSYNLGRGTELTRIGQVNMPHSLGLLYERVTSYLGFLHSSDEYKVMALASYGKPVFLNKFRDMIHLLPNGQYTIDDIKLEEVFGHSRKKDDPFTLYHYNIASSLQLALEESVLELIHWLHNETREENLCMAGGVALNCVLNARVRDKGPFKNVWVQPAAGDAGTSLGAAIWIDQQERIAEPITNGYAMQHAYFGPEYSDEEIERFLRWAKVPFRKMDNIAEETADILLQDKIIGWFQGRMEFGPRALGSRSILASPINPQMQVRLNAVKDREDFRPVAPVVLEEDAADWFANATSSPFMLFIYDVKKEMADRIPAVTHVDGTARIQTVNEQQHGEYYRLLSAFKRKSGVPVLVNTSFNTLGKPIVCTPRDAVESFWSSPFDALVIGSYLVEKS